MKFIETNFNHKETNMKTCYIATAKEMALRAVRCGDYPANHFWVEVIRASKALTISDVGVEQTNPNYDPRFEHDGGGYDQPLYTATINGVKLVVEDSSCGDFGSRFFVRVGEEFARFGTMEPELDGSTLGFKSLALLWMAGQAGAVCQFSGWRWDWLVSEAERMQRW